MRSRASRPHISCVAGGCGGTEVGKARAVQETLSCVMRRQQAILVAATKRVSVARRLIVDQQDLIARLRALKQPTTDAEAMLQTYRSALRHLEDHEDKIKQATAPAVTIPSYTVGYDGRAGRTSSGDVGATCLIRIQFRCSAAKAALRFTRWSKLKRTRRPSIRKLHAESATGRSPPAKGNSS
jgi:hypothetical protein